MPATCLVDCCIVAAHAKRLHIVELVAGLHTTESKTVRATRQMNYALKPKSKVWPPSGRGLVISREESIRSEFVLLEVYLLVLAHHTYSISTTNHTVC